MTDLKASTGPFLLQFATSIVAPRSALERRYDATRQLTQVFDGTRWRDALDAGEEDPPRTIHTFVSRETTDDN